ncbi:RNA polymerase sigma-70 factor, ECF subfamily [Clostridium cavendishii DSM 21758]|uniref:RNA polymerase sigma-70 factor, ECF subfamily n=1 Tax=Clostridium cavendishii DSM 21758 TaxID=1121302 RepID=A0A1M6VS41_9CLOT|nr:RNA polymerase sigma factor [Clostridium cavendishii]SHK84323.1 RNA polymerase sigma-70 factor, ECF subfamily [Clostridium cavendishii DSM 21758]
MEIIIGKKGETELDRVIEAKNGSKEAFSELINEHKIELYKLGKSILRDDNDIADAMQDTIYSAYKNITTLRNTKGFKVWLLRIMTNKCNDILRKKEKLVPVETMKEDSFEESYEVHNEHIYKAIGELDDELKILVMLHYYEDMSVEDISKSIKVPKGTIKSRLSRARKKLYESLKGER